MARGWSEDEKRAYRLADNQLAARASWDPEQLSQELRDLKFGEFDLGLIGFEPDQLETFLARSGIEWSDRSRQRSRNPGAAGHSAGRGVAVGGPPDRLRRQHQRS